MVFYAHPAFVWVLPLNSSLIAYVTRVLDIEPSPQHTYTHAHTNNFIHTLFSYFLNISIKKWAMWTKETYEVYINAIWVFLTLWRDKNASRTLQVGIGLKKFSRSKWRVLEDNKETRLISGETDSCKGSSAQ